MERSIDETEKLGELVASMVDVVSIECPFCDGVIEYRGETILYCEHCTATWDVTVTLL